MVKPLKCKLQYHLLILVLSLSFCESISQPVCHFGHQYIVFLMLIFCTAVDIIPLFNYDVYIGEMCIIFDVRPVCGNQEEL